MKKITVLAFTSMAFMLLSACQKDEFSKNKYDSVSEQDLIENEIPYFSSLENFNLCYAALKDNKVLFDQEAFVSLEKSRKDEILKGISKNPMLIYLFNC